MQGLDELRHNNTDSEEGCIQEIDIKRGGQERDRRRERDKTVHEELSPSHLQYIYSGPDPVWCKIRSGGDVSAQGISQHLVS